MSLLVLLRPTAAAGAPVDIVASDNATVNELSAPGPLLSAADSVAQSDTSMLGITEPRNLTEALVQEDAVGIAGDFGAVDSIAQSELAATGVAVTATGDAMLVATELVDQSLDFSVSETFFHSEDIDTEDLNRALEVVDGQSVVDPVGSSEVSAAIPAEYVWSLVEVLAAAGQPLDWLIEGPLESDPAVP